MKLIETRGNDGNHPYEVGFADAILSPLSSFGGLYSPVELPKLKLKEWLDCKNYKELARQILATLNLGVSNAFIEQSLHLYDRYDDPENPVPVVKVRDNIFVCELYHGPTRAFKDMALQPFGAILSFIARQRNENYLILAATSGDTGPAALETFKNQPNIKCVCLYPQGGTSDVQRLQMVTEDATNLKVIGIRGIFDDAQTTLKHLLNSTDFKTTLKTQGILLSAANSVNIGRIVFQIIYHVHSYLRLVHDDEIDLGNKIYLNIPSGNFGNALAAYYAMKMGLPVEKIIIASNNNNVLTELFRTGQYNIKDRTVVTTTSPAMDILKSSNIERILFDLYGSKRTQELMYQLDTEHCYQLSRQEYERLSEIFIADYCTDEEGLQIIRQEVENGYLMDPHTATCFKANTTCTKKDIPTVIFSTAEWTKFSSIIAEAMTGRDDYPDIDALQYISKAVNQNIPPTITTLFEKPIRQTTILKKEEIENEVISFLKGEGNSNGSMPVQSEVIRR